MQHKGIVFSSQQNAGNEQTTTRHVPIPLAPLVGREHEVAEIGALLRHPEERLLALTGTGGIGKTRVALAIDSPVECIVTLTCLLPFPSPIQAPSVVILPASAMLICANVNDSEQ